MRSSKSRAFVFVLRPPRWYLALLLLFWSAFAVALSKDETLRELRHTGWGADEGAPAGIHALAQTSDGYLWIANDAGLFRFDGLQFEHIDLKGEFGLASVNIYSLFAPATGGLWIGFTFGGAAFLEDGKITTYGQKEGLPTVVLALAQDGAGSVWAGGSDGLHKLEKSGWRTIGPESRAPASPVGALLVDSAGTLWAVFNSKIMYLPKGGAVFSEAPLPWTKDDENYSVAESPDGDVWMLGKKWIRHLRKNENPGRQPGNSGKYFYFDRDGGLWTFAAKEGLLRIAELLPDVVWDRDSSDQEHDIYTENDGLTPGAGYGQFLEDREGNMWVSSGTGIDRFSESNVVRVPFPDKEMARKYSFSDDGLVAGSQGSLWIGNRAQPLISLTDGSLTVHHEVTHSSCLFRRDNGAIVAGNSDGIWEQTAGRFERTAFPAHEGTWEIQAIVEDRSGALWVSVAQPYAGVWQLAKGEWTQYGGVDSLPKSAAIVLSTDEQGRVWLGYKQGEMAVLGGNGLQVFAGQDRLSIGNVTSIYGKRGNVWAGGDSGLALFDGTRFQTIVTQSGIALEDVTGIVESADGDLWLNSDSGIVRIPASQVRLALEKSSYGLDVEIFNKLDGVKGSPARTRPLPTVIEGTDGKLWFLTNVGLYTVDPAHIHRNPLPPNVLVKSVTAGDTMYQSEDGLKLPERTTALRIDYVGLSLTMGERVRYRYKLDGIDKEWQDAGTRREAFYTNLGPGGYTFHVTASNNDGVWNETGATLGLSIAPAFVQTVWFRLLCVAGATLLVVFLVRLRFRRLAAQMRIRFEERMAERERIARELHDTLLQGTQSLILKVQDATCDVPTGDPARKKLEQALDHADQLMAEGRDRIHGLRIADTANGDLSTSLRAVGEALAKGHAAEFRVSVEGRAQALLPNAFDEAYQISREALFNAFRHAQATSIAVDIRYAGDCFILCVRDDGVGIDPKIAEARSRAGHWGVRGMHERAQKIGARLEIASRPGEGAAVTLTIPAHVAYTPRASRTSWPARWGR